MNDQPQDLAADTASVVPPPRRYMRPRSLPLRVALMFSTAMTGAYGLNVTLFLVLQAVVGERWIIISLFNTFAHLLILPALILFPLCLLLRRWRLAVLVLPPFWLFVVSYGGLFLPRAAANPGAGQLSLLTYNLLAAQKNSQPMATIIRAANADVVAVQELSLEAADYLKTQLSDLYPYQALHPQAYYAGQGIFSKYPLLDETYWQMTQGFQRVVFETQGQRIVLYNAHTAFPFMSIRAFGVQRDEEIRVLLARAEQETDAVILAGDFNLTDQAETYRQITARFADAHQEIGWGMGFTFPDYTETDSHLSWLPPLSRLDYVFHDAAFQAVEARVWPTSGGSDHRPVLVRLVLKSR